MTTRPITGEQIAWYQGGSWPKFYCSKRCLLPYRDFCMSMGWSFPHQGNRIQSDRHKKAARVIPNVERGERLLNGGQRREYIAMTVNTCNFRLGIRSAIDRKLAKTVTRQFTNLFWSITSGAAEVASSLVSHPKRSRFGAGVPQWLLCTSPVP